jgi:hypothetical protein
LGIFLQIRTRLYPDGKEKLSEKANVNYFYKIMFTQEGVLRILPHALDATDIP